MIFNKLLVAQSTILCYSESINIYQEVLPWLMKESPKEVK